MALVKCRECRALVSSTAKICPGCGVKKPNKGLNSTTRLSFVLGGLFFAAIVMQVMKTSETTPAPAPATAPAAAASASKQCVSSPFEAFETGKVYVSGELSVLIDRVCPTSKWSPDQTIAVIWQSQRYLLTTVKLPYDGVAAKYQLVSVKKAID